MCFPLAYFPPLLKYTATERERERDLGKEERGWKKQRAAKQEPRKEGRSKLLRSGFEGK
jgi:hypothetical protein